MKSEQNTNIDSPGESKNVSFADMGKFIQDTWAAPDKRLKQTIAVGSSMIQGGCEEIAQEAQHHPDKLAQRAVTTLGAGALFGAALACEAPVIVGAATITGAVMTGAWLGDVGRKLYTDHAIRSNLDSVWKTGSPKNYQELKQNLGTEGRDLILATGLGTAGFSAGSRIKGIGSVFKQIDAFRQPLPALATAGEGTALKPQYKNNAAEKTENCFAMSKPSSYDPPEWPAQSNREHFDNVRVIKDAIEHGDLKDAENCAYINALFSDDLIPSKEVDGVAKSFRQVAATIRQAMGAPESRKQMLTDEALKQLDSLEKIDIENVRKLSLQREAQHLHDTHSRMQEDFLRTRDRNPEVDELTKFLLPEEEGRLQQERMCEREQQDLARERERIAEQERAAERERSAERERRAEERIRRMHREERDRGDDFGR